MAVHMYMCIYFQTDQLFHYISYFIFYLLFLLYCITLLCYIIYESTHQKTVEGHYAISSRFVTITNFLKIYSNLEWNLNRLNLNRSWIQWNLNR